MARQTDGAAARSVADIIERECIAVRLRMLNRVVTNVYDEALRPLGITVGQVNILVAVSKLPSATASEVGRALQIEKSTLSRTIERMRTQGWLAVSADEDGRASRLEITAAGARILEHALSPWREAQRRVRELLGAGAERALRHAASKVSGGTVSD